MSLLGDFATLQPWAVFAAFFVTVLALPPTLSGFFAQLRLSISRPIRAGGFLELEDGAQGHIVDIGWRAARWLQRANHLVLVPNARLAEVRLADDSLPDAAEAVLLPVGVAYGSALDRVEALTFEVARQVRCGAAESDRAHEPFVRFGAFSASSMDLAVIPRAGSITDRWRLIHEFIRRPQERSGIEGIEIPFPQRRLHLALERR